MSRIGKLPVKIPEKVKVTVDGTTVRVEGPKGKTSFKANALMKFQVAKGEVKVLRPDESTLARALHGLTRTLVRNAIDGVTKGYERTLDIVASASRPRGRARRSTSSSASPTRWSSSFPRGSPPRSTPSRPVTVRGVDKHLLGMTAARIRELRPPEPYKGKGIKYATR